MYCSQCGTQNPDEASFCSNCQHKLKEGNLDKPGARQAAAVSTPQHRSFSFGASSLGAKIILVSLGLAVLSLFLPWVDAIFMTLNGFDQQGYLLLVFFIYPIYVLFTNKPMNKLLGYGSGAVGLIANIAFISSKSVDFFGVKVNAAESGMYIFAAALVIMLIGVFMYSPTGSK